MVKTKAWFWGALLIFGVALLLGIKFIGSANSGASHEISPSVAGMQSRAAIAKSREVKRAQSIVGQGISDLHKIRLNPTGSQSPDSQTLFPEACQTRFEKIASLALSDLIREIKLGVLVSDKACEENENSQLERRNIKVNMGQCSSLFAQMDDPEIKAPIKPSEKIDPRIQECETAIMYLRASIIDQLFPDSERESLPSQVLANKILLRLGNALGSEDERSRVLSLAEELAKREPNLYASHKAVAVLSLFEPGREGKINPDNPKFLEAIAVCKEFGVNDPELEETAFLSLAAADRADRFGVVARSILAENPKSAVANYYLAYDFFKNGNREEAVRLLTLANAFAPGDERIRDTLEKAKTAKPTDKIFSSRMSISFTDEAL